MTVLRNPVAWVYGILAIAGVVGLAPVLRNGFDASPLGFTLALVLWAVFAAFVWWLIRRLSRTRPRPRTTTFAAFFWGAIIAAGVGTWATGGVGDISRALVSDGEWAGALSAGVSEELLKILGVAALALFAASRMRTALDFVYYGAFVGLGFMVTESLLYAASGAATADSPVAIVIDSVILRGILALPWSHPTYTAIAAIGLWHLLRSTAPAARRWALFFGLLILSMLLHAFFDSPLLESNAMIAFFAKGLPALVAFLALYLPLRRRAAREQAASPGPSEEPVPVAP